MNRSSTDNDSDVERTRDLHERDEFAGRLKKKDAEKTRKVMSKSEQKVCCHCSCSRSTCKPLSK